MTTLGSMLKERNKNNTIDLDLIYNSLNKNEKETIKNELNKFDKLFSSLKQKITAMANGEDPINKNSQNEITITESRIIFRPSEIYGYLYFEKEKIKENNSLCFLLTSEANINKKSSIKKDFVFGYKLEEKIKELSDWLTENEIEDIKVKYAHDGVGLVDWNLYYLKY